MKKIIICILVLSLAALCACKGNTETKNTEEGNASGISSSQQSENESTTKAEQTDNDSGELPSVTYPKDDGRESFGEGESTSSDNSDGTATTKGKADEATSSGGSKTEESTTESEASSPGGYEMPQIPITPSN